MLKKSKQKKGYAMDLVTRFDVTFTKNHASFKKGETTSVTLPVALRFLEWGIIAETAEIKEAKAKANITATEEAKDSAETKKTEKE